MENEIITTKEYRDWLVDVKRRVQSAQLKAATAVNTTLLEFYGSLGADIAEKQKNTAWGSGFLKQLSKDLMAEFSDLKGFSRRNFELIRRWYLFFSQGDSIAKQPVSQLPQEAQQSTSRLANQIASQIVRIPWGHNIAIFQKGSTVEQAVFYVQKTIEHNWSRSVLILQIKSDLFARSGKAITNFEKTGSLSFSVV